MAEPVIKLPEGGACTMTLPVFPFQRLAKLGILGGGQLGRMLAEAAHDFGLQTVVYCQNQHEPAAQIATQVIVGSWTDESAIEQFATSGIRWVVGEWENVEPAVVDQIGNHIQVHTMANVLRTGRSRTAEKKLANLLGIETTIWSAETRNEKGSFVAGTVYGNLTVNQPIILKTDNGGYDGKGQWRFDSLVHAQDYSWTDKDPREFVAEVPVELDYECSVLVERDISGVTKASPAVLNKHTNRHGGGILEYSCWSESMIRHESKARSDAVKLAEAVDLVGVICVEFFVTKDGRLLFNELAPRVHNSFHGSIEATTFSQFHRHVAAVVGIKLPEMRFSQPWVMVNLIGNQIDLLPKLLEHGWSVHDYGKTSVKKGRKMGHATALLKHEYGGVPVALETLKELGLVE